MEIDRLSVLIIAFSPLICLRIPRHKILSLPQMRLKRHVPERGIQLVLCRIPHHILRKLPDSFSDQNAVFCALISRIGIYGILRYHDGNDLIIHRISIRCFDLFQPQITLLYSLSILYRSERILHMAVADGSDILAGATEKDKTPFFVVPYAAAFL